MHFSYVFLSLAALLSGCCFAENDQKHVSKQLPYDEADLSQPRSHDENIESLPRTVGDYGRVLSTRLSKTGYAFGAARLWLGWKSENDKLYTTHNEEIERFEHFTDNYKFVQEWNEKFQQGEVSFDLALNRFADMPAAEVKSMMNGFKAEKAIEQRAKLQSRLKTFAKDASFKRPDEIDWRTTNAVTKVKDQGHCGCCWACSTTGTMESHYFLLTRQQVVLSEQNLIDCSRRYGNEGCNGGLMDNAFDYIEENGIEKEEDYPFEGRDGKCRFDKKKALNVRIKSYVDIPSGDEEALAEAVAKVGPIAVAIDASHSTFHFYTEGVYKEPHCGNDTHALDHAVLLVGYGTDAKTKEPYWLIKNSWSTKWGESGYIRMAKDRGNMCGIASMASYPILEVIPTTTAN